MNSVLGDISRADYDGYGNTDDSVYGNLGYCGEYTDYETGFIYLRARYYDPSLGRFISEDPARDGLNWYAYCYNNPVNFVDPSGKVAIEVVEQFLSSPTGQMLYEWLWSLAQQAEVSITTFVSQNWTWIQTAVQYGVELWNQITSRNQSTSKTKPTSRKVLPSDQIDWGRDENGIGHILRGSKESKNAHGPIWKRFNIDPNNNNNWWKLLPILKTVVDKGTRTIETVYGKHGKQTGQVFIYVKNFVDEGVRVTVKVFVDLQGNMTLSDAYGAVLK